MTLSSITSTHPVPRTPSLRPERRGAARAASTDQSKSLQRAIVVGAAVAAVAGLGWYFFVCLQFNAHGNEAGGAARVV